MPAIVDLPGASRANAYLIPPEQLEQKEDSRKWSDQDVKELALDISEGGQLQPVLVTWDRPPLGKERLVIVAGRRRVAAIRYINEHDLPGAPMKVLCLHFKGEETFKAATVENVKRKGLTPIDLAHVIVTMEAQGKTRKEIAKLLEISESLISQTLKLLKLPLSKQREVHAGRISAAAGYEMADMAPEDRQKVTGYSEPRRQAPTPQVEREPLALRPDSSQEAARLDHAKAQPSQIPAPSSQPERQTQAEPPEASQPETKVTRSAIREVKREKAERGEQTSGPIARNRKEIREIFAAYATCEDGTIEEPIRKCCATIVSCIDGEVGSRAVLNRMRELIEAE